MSSLGKKIYVCIALGIVFVVAIAYFIGSSRDAAEQTAADTAHSDIVGTWIISDYSSNDPKKDIASYKKDKSLTGKGYILECSKTGNATLTLYDKKKGKMEYSGGWQWSEKKTYYFVQTGTIRFRMNRYSDDKIFSSDTGHKSDKEKVIWSEYKAD